MFILQTQPTRPFNIFSLLDDIFGPSRAYGASGPGVRRVQQAAPPVTLDSYISGPWDAAFRALYPGFYRPDSSGFVEIGGVQLIGTTPSRGRRMLGLPPLP